MLILTLLNLRQYVLTYRIMKRMAINLLSLISTSIVGASAAWFFAVNAGETKVVKQDSKDRQKQVVCSLGTYKKGEAVIGSNWKSGSSCICEEVSQ